MIWNQDFTLQGLNNSMSNTLASHLGISFVEKQDNYLIAKMPVDHRTHQPFGILHGGASAALAETVGSFAGMLCLRDVTKNSIVGVEINANHLKSVRSGFVYAKVNPIRIGRTIQVWEINISDEEENLICVSRLTLAVVQNRV